MSKRFTNNCKFRNCKRMVSRVRRLQPSFWIPVLSITLALYIIVLPHSFWKHIWVTLMAHKVLLSMLVLFCLLAISLIWTTGQSIDAYVFSFFNRHGNRPKWLDRTMLLLTELGNGIVTVVIAIVLFFAVNEHLAYEFILGTLTLWLVVELLKFLIRRPRPYSYLTDVRVVGTRARGNSFPSGHTSQAFYMATMLFQYFKANILVAVILYLLAALVGTTRMYMGMHYPRDVLAGAILGSFWGVIGVVVNDVIFKMIGFA